MIFTLIQEWNLHIHLHTECSRSYNPFVSLVSNKLLTQLLEIPYPLEGKSLQGVLSQCETEDVFNDTVHNAFTKYQLIHPIDVYYDLIADRSVPISYILSFEHYPEMQKLLHSVSKQRTHIILHWLERGEQAEFDNFIYRAKHIWLWNMHNVFSPNLSEFNREICKMRCQLGYSDWFTLVSNGLIPLCVFHTSNNAYYDFLHEILKAFRLVRRHLQRRFKLLRHYTTKTLKRMHFMIKCNPDHLTKHKIQRVGIHYTNQFSEHSSSSSSFSSSSSSLSL